MCGSEKNKSIWNGWLEGMEGKRKKKAKEMKKNASFASGEYHSTKY